MKPRCWVARDCNLLTPNVFVYTEVFTLSVCLTKTVYEQLGGLFVDITACLYKLTYSVCLRNCLFAYVFVYERVSTNTHLKCLFT